MRTAFSCLCLILTAALSLSAQVAQPARVDTARLQKLLVAEDARGTGVDGITPLTTEIRATDPLLRRVAVRGVGRLQRPELMSLLVVALTDAVPAIRATAADAMAQSVSRVHPIADRFRAGPRADRGAGAGEGTRERIGR